jgi:DNA-binding CsgD family transcriptional regulator
VIAQFRHRRRQRRLPLRGRRPVDLTRREWEVLSLMREGLSTREIADRLFVEPVTVRTHVSSILRKLRVPSRDAALELLG